MNYETQYKRTFNVFITSLAASFKIINKFATMNQFIIRTTPCTKKLIGWGKAQKSLSASLKSEYKYEYKYVLKSAPPKKKYLRIWIIICAAAAVRALTWKLDIHIYDILLSPK